MLKISFKFKGSTKTCYRFESGEKPDFQTLYLKKDQLDKQGIDPAKGITVTIEQEES